MIFVEEETSLDSVYKIHLENFSDNRGEIVNLFDIDQFSTFKVDKMSKSKRNVLRGLHGDISNDKLIYCLYGKIYLVVVNYDKDSPQYLQKIGIEMSDDKPFAVFVPKNFLNGHYCLSETCLFYYKWSDSYVSPEKQFSVRWDDEDLDITWPLLEAEPILSDRDKNSKTLKEKKNE
jgi:dTDP-4-dehydrorhamnose 3,5-epimerase